MYQLPFQPIPQNLMGNRGKPRTQHLIRPRPDQGIGRRPRYPRTGLLLQAVGHEYPTRDVQSDAGDFHS
jgi:hypothetical protein